MNLVLMLFLGRLGCQNSKKNVVLLKYLIFEARFSFFYGQNKTKLEFLYIKKLIDIKVRKTCQFWP